MNDLTAELDEFNSFVSERLNGSSDLTLEQVLERFRQYQRELATAREKLRIAEEQSARSESGPLDAEAMKTEVRKRLAAEGITE